MVIVRIPLWLARDRGLPLEVVVKTVHRETERAVLVSGHGHIHPSVFCLRCKRELTNPASRVVGIGPECCSLLGVVRPDLDDAKVLNDQLVAATTFSELWLPKSQIEVLEGELIVHATPATEAPTRLPVRLVRDEKQKCLLLSTEFEDRALARGIYRQGGFDGQTKAWRLIDEAFSVLQVLMRWPDAQVEPSSLERYRIPAQLHPELRPFQREGVEHLCRAGRALLGDDMGLGKTFQLLAAARSRRGRTLVITLSKLKGTWAHEIRKFFPECNYAVVESGDDEEKKRQFQAPVDFVIANYEACLETVRTVDEVTGEVTRSREPMTILRKMKWSTVILDESHRCKNRESKTYKAVRQLSATTQSMFLASGTFMSNGTMDLWAQLNILYPKTFSSYWDFAETFCRVEHNGYGYDILDIDDEDDPKSQTLRQMLDPILLRRTKIEVMPELPPKTIVRVGIDLSGAQKRHYLEMEELMMTEIGDEAIFASIAMAQIVRLKQICTDPTLMIGDDSPLTGPKVEAALELIESAEGQKVVVFSQFASVARRFAMVLQRHRIGHVLFTGETADTAEAQTALLDRFTSNSSVRVFCATIQAGGTGLNLQAASICIFLDKMWSPSQNRQAQDRIYRMGQTVPVTIYELIANDTIEEVIDAVLTRKMKVIDLALRSNREVA